ncbi:uncharacterized protein LOC135169466 isoform X2 [Diachasmimorpha longicaudata]|uniref:uncharacterized protein LOC135169466 isoform X2 n=1 Tax=Diachasmimorpha longicaudata TaxID=58733 RepID=UPI0030B8AFA2
MTTKSRRNRTRPETDVGFRLLDSANINDYYLSVVNYEPPEPPRAPEPYKLASSTMARAHRKSSFVILAETEEGEDKSPSDSPIHGGHTRSGRSRSPLSPSRGIRTGRASPFRPRGFKGPPPHAQSRPPTPPAPTRRRRFVQPKSLSQGNSPRKQSLIPQPRGGLTTIKPKTQKPERERWERRGSRKFTHLPRTSSLKTPQPVKRPLIESVHPTKEKVPRAMTKLPKQAIKSPTKIPIRTPTSSIPNRFVKMSNDHNSKIKNSEAPPVSHPHQLPPDVPPSTTSTGNPDSSPLVTDDSVVMGRLSGHSDDSISGARNEEELGLVDLLKQSSGASGTSSVVNATTATAVQPLRIDAASVVPEPQVITERKTPVVLPPVVNSPRKESPSLEERRDVERQTVTAVASVEPVKEESIPQVQPSRPKPTTSRDEVKLDRDEARNNPVEVEALRPSNIQDTKAVIDETQRTRAGAKAQVAKPQSNRTSPRSAGGGARPHGERETDGDDVQVSTTADNKLRNHGSEASLKSSKSNGLSTGSVESIRSTDTGVSLNTVRGVHGVSSAREKRGTHMVKRTDEIETLSGNVMHLERERRAENGEPAGLRWGRKVAPSESNSCCRPEGTCGFLCYCNWCRLPSCDCCRCCHCCRRNSDAERTKNIRAKHSLTSVAPPPLSEAQKSKLPEVLVEHSSVMRGAIPCLPVPLAWFCLVWNVLLPGTGTVWSGLFNLCAGQPRFAQTASGKSRFGALIVNIIVGASQAFTVLFCLVGWGWSIWWAVTMIRLARKWKRFKAAEATNGDPEARGPEGVLPAPGVPTHALRGVERAR